MNTLNSNLDNTDWKILTELQRDARLSFAELGRRVGLSSPAVQERVRRLEDAGVIEGYHVKVNAKKVGLPIMSWTRLVDLQGKYNIEQVAEIAKTTPEILNCYHLIGQDEYLLQIVATSVEHLELVLQKFTEHCQSISSIVIKASVSNRPIQPHITQFTYEEEES